MCSAMGGPSDMEEIRRLGPSSGYADAGARVALGWGREHGRHLEGPLAAPPSMRTPGSAPQPLAACALLRPALGRRDAGAPAGRDCSRRVLGNCMRSAREPQGAARQATSSADVAIWSRARAAQYARVQNGLLRSPLKLARPAAPRRRSRVPLLRPAHRLHDSFGAACRLPEVPRATGCGVAARAEPAVAAATAAVAAAIDDPPRSRAAAWPPPRCRRRRLAPAGAAEPWSSASVDCAPRRLAPVLLRAADGARATDATCSGGGRARWRALLRARGGAAAAGRATTTTRGGARADAAAVAGLHGGAAAAARAPIGTRAARASSCTSPERPPRRRPTSRSPLPYAARARGGAAAGRGRARAIPAGARRPMPPRPRSAIAAAVHALLVTVTVARAVVPAVAPTAGTTSAGDARAARRRGAGARRPRRGGRVPRGRRAGASVEIVARAARIPPAHRRLRGARVAVRASARCSSSPGARRAARRVALRARRAAALAGRPRRRARALASLGLVHGAS